MFLSSALFGLSARMSSSQQGVPPTSVHEAEVCGVLTRFVLTAYSNRVMVVVTQTQNMGTLLLAQRDNPMSAASPCYSVRVLLGRRDDEDAEAYARTMVELISKRAPDAGPLLLAISLKEGAYSPDMFRGILRQVEEHRVW